MRLRVLSILAFWLLSGWLVWSSTQRNEGDFTYPLDDTYIHLAVAQHIAGSGTWGVNDGEFSSCTSSITWPLLLVPTELGVPWAEWMPLLLNLLLGTFVLILVDRWLQEQYVGSLIRLAVLAAFVGVVPLAVMTTVGLEHVAQILFALALLRWGMEMIDGPRTGPHRIWRGMIFAALLTATRFEGLFLVLPLAWLLHRRGRGRLAVRLVMAAALPLVIFGVYSMAQGGRFLPTPVWMKGRLGSELLPALLAARGDVLQWGQLLLDFVVLAPLRALAEVGALSWLVLAALGWLLWSRAQGRRLVGLWVVLGTIWLHLIFARTGWLGRYEAWLLAMLIMVIAPFAQEWLDRLREARFYWRILALVMLVAFVALPVRVRVASSHFQANRGSTNIHEQQVQMARFLDRYRNGETVAVNDIGAVNYLADIRCVDIWGLSDESIAAARLDQSLDPHSFGWIVQKRGAEIAAVYESVLEETGGTPPGWLPVADWSIQRNAVCGSSRVTWFATSVTALPRLLEELEQFEGSLPSGVEVRWRHGASR